MYRYFTFNNSQQLKSNLHKKRYLDVLDKLVESYNNSYHRSIKTKPILVNKNNEKKVFVNLYGYNIDEHDNTEVKIKFKPGTYVRIVKAKSIFEKGYTAKWSDKIYIIKEIIAQVPIM
jgi:hypothetical protein